MRHFVIVYFQHEDSEMEFMGWNAPDKETAVREFNESNPDMWGAMAYEPAK
jgi:hypothetical protein